MNLSALALACMPLVWLLPNHYPPWSSAWQDGSVLALLFLAAIAARTRPRIDWPWVALAIVTLGSVSLQWTSGRIFFSGDALMAAFYIGALVVALLLGSTLGVPADEPSMALDALALSTLSAAIVSVGIALAQWTSALPSNIFTADLPPGARPFGNIAQPNHLCSLAFLGMCAAFLLRESRCVGRFAWALACLWLILGMVMSGSRTGWLQMAMLLVSCTLWRHRVRSRLHVKDGAVLGFAFVAAVWSWPIINEALMLSGGRSFTQQIDGGARLPLWRILIDAIERSPWWGYGWQQMTLAHQAVALDHAPILRHFEHSHNIILDLMLWAGVPVGVVACALIAAALWKLVRSLRDARALWLTVGVLGLLAHAMLEYPLEYAYFLVPAGLVIGACTVMTPKRRPLCVISLPVLRLTGLLGLLLLVIIASDYLRAEENYRQLRLESARIGASRVQTDVPPLLVLSQLEALLRLGRTEASRDFSDEAVDAQRRAAQRFAHPSAMLWYALVAGLNNRPEEARATLKLLCSIHPSARCDEARQSWRDLQGRFPVLSPVMPFQ